MKKLVGTIIVLLTLTTGMYAQDKKNNMPPDIPEQIKIEKISFLTAQLDLTPAEAQVFWPVYNEFEKKRLALEWAQRRPGFKKDGKPDSFSDEELKKMNENYINSFSEEALLMQEYNKRFLEVLPIQKVMKLYESERKFRSHMLQEFRRRGQGQGPEEQGPADGQEPGGHGPQKPAE